ncbi:MAG: hypothetical protein U0T82_12500 [Bacteroidales bacterium]
MLNWSSRQPSFLLLLKEESVSIINLVQNFRQRTGIPACFTIDAGPNIHLLYPWSGRDAVLDFISEDLLPFCEGRSWIDDRMGVGQNHSFKGMIRNQEIFYAQDTSLPESIALYRDPWLFPPHTGISGEN